MPETLSRIVQAIGAKEHYYGSFHIYDTDVIDDLGVNAIPKIFVFHLDSGLFMPISIDTDWSSFTFKFAGTFASEEAARRNTADLGSSEKAGRVFRWILGTATLGVSELFNGVVAGIHRNFQGYVLDSFAYYSLS